MRILCLEDMDHRVEWLEGIVAGTGARVVWCPTVAAFREALSSIDDVALIVLDHDLGPSSITSGDEHGETGLDGCRALPDAARAIPILVWSVNRVGAEQMVPLLRSRGFAARRVPFLDDLRWTLRMIVARAIAAANEKGAA